MFDNLFDFLKQIKLKFDSKYILQNKLIMTDKKATKKYKQKYMHGA